MSSTFACPTCGVSLTIRQIPTRLMTVPCPKCGGLVTVKPPAEVEPLEWVLPADGPASVRSSKPVVAPKGSYEAPPRLQESPRVAQPNPADASQQRPAYDVFLSYSSRDKTTADAICATLERDKVRCWIAPRDILPGSNYGEAIIDGINSSRALVVVLSAASNASPQVLREVERAVHKGIPIIPFRIEDITPSRSMEYFLSAPHWLDALTPPLEAHINQLTSVVRAVLDPKRAVAVPVARPAAELPIARPVAIPLKKKHNAHPSPRRSRGKRWATLGAGGLAAFALVMCLVVWRWSPKRQPDLPAVSSQSERLNEEYVEYRKQVSAGRGSVVFLQKNAPTRYPDWRAEADGGNPIGQLFIGRCYQEGFVVKRDAAAAIPWLEKSAEKGNYFAMHTLGLAYEEGQGVKLDPGQSLQWYKKAADAGNPVAMRAIGRLYAGSLLDKPNPERSLLWYRKAADAGDPVAMRLIGNHYLHGTGGLPRDKKESEIWHNKAVAAGDAYGAGLLFGNRLAPHFAAYLGENATAKTKSAALAALRDLRGEYDQLDLLAITAIYEASDLRNATVAIGDLKSDDPLRLFYNSLTQKYMTLYAAASRSERTMGLGSFSLVTESLIQGQYEDKKYDAVASFWERSYKDLPLSEVGADQEINAVIRHMNWSAASLIRVGQRKEAAEVLASTLDLCDRSLRERPWDWYTKDAYSGLCFEAAAAWFEVGEAEAAQPLLLRAWTVRLRQYGKEALLTKYPELPLKGKVPEGASAEDKQFFERFGPDADKSKSGMKRFTVPCDFSGTKYPFHVYVLTGKRGYAELQDQFRWLNEIRGGEVPTEVRESFLRLNKIAVENNVDFMELCVYALGTAADDKTEEEVRQIISKQTRVATDKIDKKKPLSAPPVKLDDLDAVAVVMSLEEKFNIKIPASKASGIQKLTLEEVVKLIGECKKSSPKDKK